MRADVILQHLRLSNPNLSAWQRKEQENEPSWGWPRCLDSGVQDLLLPAGFPQVTSSVLSKAHMVKQVPPGKQALQKQNDALWEEH